MASGLALLAGVVLFLLVCLISTDVIFRYLFTAPILGVEDTLQMGMVVVIFGCAPFVWRRAEHIVVDLLPEFRRSGARVARDLSVRGLVSAVMGLLAWQAWVSAGDAAFFGNATNMIEIPYQPFYWMIAVSACLHVVVVLTEAYLICMGQPVKPLIDSDLAETQG